VPVTPHRTIRQLLWGCLTLQLLLAVRAAAAQTEAPEAPREPADADATKLACAKAYEMSQRWRQDGKLQQAREQALACAQPACPAVLIGDCTNWLAELDAALASVILEVRDARGQLVTNASVSVDGVPLASALDGRALPLDPGTRAFTVMLPNGKKLQRSLVISEGQKAQLVRFEIPAEPAPAPARPARRGPSALLYGAAAFGVMGGVGFAYFGLQGRADEQNLRDGCAPRCSDADLAPLERTYLAADVSLGIGVVAASLFGYLWLTRDDEPAPATAVGAQITSRSAALSLRKRF
jgi:hypothetical protein